MPSQGSDDLDRRLVDHHRHDVVHEGDADGRLAERHGLGGSGARLGVLVDVLVQGLEVIEALVLAHDLDDRGQQRIGGAGRVRVRDLDLVLELGVEQVGPAFRLAQALST